MSPQAQDVNADGSVNDFVTVIGPDKKTYSFPAGTTKPQAIAYFRKRGIGATASVKPSAQPSVKSGDLGLPPLTSQWEATKYGIGEAAKGVGDFLKGIGQTFDPRRQPGENALTQIPLYRMGKSMIEPLTKTGQVPEAIKDLYQQGDTGLAALAATMPRAGGQGAAMLMAPEIAKKIGEVAPKVAPAMADFLRTKSAEMGAKRLHVEPKTAADIGRERIVGTTKSLATRVDPVSKAKLQGQFRQIIEQRLKPQIARGLAQADASGVKIDAGQEMASIYNDALKRVKPSEVKPLRKAFLDVENKVDPASGKVVPRNMSQLSATEAYELTQTLNREIMSDAHSPTSKNALIKTREMLGAKLDQVAPGTAKLRSTESSFIEADSALSEQYAQGAKGLRKASMAIWRSAGPLAVYVTLRGLGSDYAASAATIYGMMMLDKMPLTVTQRMALANRVADFLDNPSKAVTVRPRPSGPSAAKAGPSGPAAPPTVPKAPTGAPAPTGAQGTPQVALPQGVTAVPRQAPPTAMPPGQSAALPELPPVQKMLGGGGTVNDADVMATINRDVERRVGTPQGGYKGPERRATSTTSATSMVSPKTKAMLDRVDTLLARKDIPKTALDRELSDIKKALSKDTPPEERKLIEERIGSRERQAKHRAKAKAETPGSSSATPKASPGDVASSAMSPEQRVMLLEQGYKEMSKYPGGQEWSQAIQQNIPAEQQVQALAEALEFLKEQKK